METFSGRCLLGWFSQGGRQRTTILADTVECHCCYAALCHQIVIYKVISQKGERVLFERLSTPRSAPKVVLKSSSQKQQQQQQQQDTSESASARSWKQSARSSVKEDLKDNPGNPTEDSETSRSWKQNCKKDSSVEEKPEFKVVLGIERLAQDVILKDEERMGQIQEVSGKIEERLTHEIYSGRVEKTRKLNDLQRGIQPHHPWTGQHRAVRIRTNVQHHPMPFVLQTCWKDWNSVWCGMCLRPDEETIRKIQARFQTLIVPHYLARVDRSRGKKVRWCTQWQKDHWKAVDASRATNKHGKDTITIRWQEDEQWRESQMAHGWTEEYWKYLDYLKTIDTEYTATCGHRHRYESTITLACATKDRQCGPMNRRSDYKPTTLALISHRQEQGRQDSYIPKNERTRQKPFDKELQAKLKWLSKKLEDLFRAIFFLFIIFTKLVATWTRKSRLSMAWKSKHSTARSPMARSPIGKIMIGLKI